ncbi:MAG: hydroxymethylpyrimidine/phosphomethylpyrimidine kinase [Nitrosomonas sp.]|nr:MAG: hydroxymethylpyrimidine/phosphomethylpyrimidine kinase [Nitrosomonas sp.]
MLQPPPIVLSFAANDPSGGAGLQADMLTIASMGCHPLSIVTAITIQDTTGVNSVMPLDAEWIADQARTVLEDMPVQVFKIGLLGSVEIISAITEVISDYPHIPVVLDPILTSGRGDELASEAMIDALCTMLLPQVTLITPNSLEARRLALQDGDDPESRLELELCARRLFNMGSEYVLITGTHENTKYVTNTLFDENGVMRIDEWERLENTYHGSGCTLASSIAASLASGLSLVESVIKAQDYTWHTLQAGFRPGMGQYIPNRLFWAQNLEEADNRKD